MSADSGGDHDSSLDPGGKPKGDTFCENSINLALLDPPRFGWTAAGNVADLLTPHERARRKSTKKAYVASKRNKKRDRTEACSNGTGEGLASPLVEPPTARLKSVPEADSVVALYDTAMDVEKTGVDGSLNGVSARLSQHLLSGKSGSTLNTGHSSANSDSESETDRVPLRFKAVPGDGMLDIYAYHRGREGMELRNEQTGELLCDVKATDSNHGSDEPKTLTATIDIQFPLENNDDSAEVRMYKESIQWDLTNPETPNPMVFAARIAEDFGLSYTQTSDLVESIQSQLFQFVNDTCAYASPALLKTPQQDKPTAMVPYLYGGVTGLQQLGGTARPVTQKQRAVLQKANSFASARSTSVKTTTGSGKVPAKKRASETRKAEEEFYQQVRTRLYEASVSDVNAKLSSGNDSDDSLPSISKTKDLVMCENEVCHICRQPQAVCWMFPCGTSSHAYCSNHLSERLGLVPSKAKTSPLQLDFCPICSLACNCQDCSGILDVAALEFKDRCDEQEATPESTEFEDLFDRCQEISLEKQGKVPAKPKIKRRSPFKPRPVVPKLPVSEFPREVANGVDLDHGFETDYNTLFTEDGAFLITSEENTGDHNGSDASPDKVPASPSLSAPIEDGSVDFCNVCRKVGNLVCCDCCPRAFHSKCISPEDLQEDSRETAKWECPCCTCEKQGLPEDKLDGALSLTALCSAFGDCATSSSTDINHLQGLKLLSILKDMLRILMDYDFGYMFRDPVDLKAIPSYKAIVKRPMDLGTIASNLVNGFYKKSLGAKRVVLEDVALAVLKDIELVWHNCFIFNIEGSAVYRMAEAMKRRAHEIQRRSFDYLLSERMKQELAEYVASCEREREVHRQTLDHRRQSLPATPQARHKISGVSRGSNNSRAVAVLNPDTGRIAKIYTTLMSASNAVKLLLTLKHDCEYEEKDMATHQRLRGFLIRSTEDQRYLLYGYRWVYLDDLKNQKVSFARPALEGGIAADETNSDADAPAARSGLVEMVDGGLTYFFNSIDESLSYPGLPCNVSNIRERLLSLVPETDFANIAGRMWRRLQPGRGRMASESVGVVPSLQGQTLGSDAAVSREDVSLNPDVCIVKEDRIVGERALLGFKTKVAAFQDWLQTLDISAFPYQGPRSMEIFLEYYLDGDRNVDGIGWRTVREEKPVKDKRSVNGGTNTSESHGVGGPARKVVPTKQSASSENHKLSKVFDVECVPSPNSSRARATLTNGNKQMGSFQTFQM